MKYSLGERTFPELIGPNLVEIGPDLVKWHGFMLYASVAPISSQCLIRVASRPSYSHTINNSRRIVSGRGLDTWRCDKMQDC